MKKNIVIVGAGFAGINTYKSLPRWVKKNCNITIIDRHNYFLFTPLLHEVATGALNAHHVVEPIESIVGSEVVVIQDTVTAFDHADQQVRLQNNNDVPYDILVLGIGSQTNFFGTHGAEERSFVLKNLYDAELLRNHFVTRFQEASLMDTVEQRKKHLTTVIVGGGPTGVEIAGEASELFFHSFKKQYEGSFDTSEAHITLVNASATILQPFSPGSQYYAQRVLREKHVDVRNNIRVTEIADDSVITTEGEVIPAATVIWAAGVIPEHIDCPPSVLKDRNKIHVEPTLQLKEHENVFVLGDMALVETEDTKGYPTLAQVAQQQGVQTALNIQRLLKKEPLLNFVYKEKGKLVSLGQWHAIAELGSVHLQGALAWFIWRTIYLINFASWNKRFKIVADWTSNLFNPRDTTKLN